MEFLNDVDSFVATMNSEKSGILQYHLRLNIFSPQRCDCYGYLEMLQYVSGQLETEKMGDAFIHLEELNCQACWSRIPNINNRHEALAAIEGISKSRLSHKKVRSQEKKTQVSSSDSYESWRRKLGIIGCRHVDMKYLNGDLEFGVAVSEPAVAIGQVWLSRLSENRRPGKIRLIAQPPMWPLLITGINSENQTFKVLPISPDKGMYDSNLTCRIDGDEYWNSGLIELFNEFSMTRDKLAIYKGEFNEEQWQTLEESRAKLSWDLPMLETFSEWSDRELELSTQLHYDDSIINLI